MGNGGKGVEVFNNASGSSNAPIYLKQNTSWGNLTDPHQSGLGCGDVALKVSKDVQLSGNLISTRSATGCGGHPVYAVGFAEVDGSDSFVNNAVYGYNGYNEFSWDSGSFTWGSNNVVVVYPNFTNPVTPGRTKVRGHRQRA